MRIFETKTLDNVIELIIESETMAFYKDYFMIDEQYTPNMTREAIKQMWLQFYPHESFVAFLRAVLGQNGWRENQFG